MKLNFFLLCVFLYFTALPNPKGDKPLAQPCLQIKNSRSVVPTALFRLQTVPHNYYFIKTKATWTAAQTYCREAYVDLATVESTDDWVKLKQATTSTGLTSYVWLGHYNDVKSWRWTFNDLSLMTTAFTMWKTTEPDNFDGREFCGVISKTGYWADYACTILMSFICYNANYSGSARYIGVPTALGWTAARAYCQQYHTDLASATNSAENSYIQQVASSLGNCWFGLHRVGWKWSDGTTASDPLWYPGLPNNLNGLKDCGMLYNGLLADEICTSQYYFFCHKIPPIREQQTVRLQLKADDSVLDPAVQSAILERIKQKLAERNMLQNITVTWRKNPDGSVFSKKTSDDDNL